MSVPPGDPQQRWIEELARLRAAGTPCALVTVTGVRGSGPREAGARMLVAEGRLHWGTVGGGRLEARAIEHASALLGRAVAGEEVCGESVAYPLSEAVGQCCGGEVTLFYEAFPWRRRSVVLFGAGHVAQAFGGLAPWLRADVLLVDPRSEEELQPTLPPASARPYRVLFVDAPEAEVADLPDDACVLILTHDHGLDLEVLVEALKRPFPYVGLIGSERKWARFRRRLEQRGVAPEDVARVRCPIGATRTSKEPTAIAVSAAAEVLEVLEGLADPVRSGAPPAPSAG